MRIKVTQEQAMSSILNGDRVSFYNSLDGTFDTIDTVYDLIMISITFLPSEYWVVYNILVETNEE